MATGSAPYVRLRRRCGDRRGPEDREYRRRDGPDERQGLHALLVRPDTATKSACNGACATAWPPQTASATAKSPYTTIKRTDGSTQLVFNGHPLYTFTGDTAPGTASGNGVNAFGGLWHEVPASGAAAPVGTAPTSGGGGY